MDVTTTNKVLNWLLEKYLENPNAQWDIADCVRTADETDVESIHELGNHLVKKGFVKKLFRRQCCATIFSSS